MKRTFQTIGSFILLFGLIAVAPIIVTTFVKYCVYIWNLIM